MAEILDLFYEADNVPVESGGIAGEKYKDYSISVGETWVVMGFGGSSYIDETEIELLYSTDGGSTFINPNDNTTDKIRCIHLSVGTTSKLYFEGLEFNGGTNHILRLKAKNYNSVNAAEIVCWVVGIKK